MRVLVLFGASATLAGILSFLVDIHRAFTLALLTLGAACMILGAWYVK